MSRAFLLPAILAVLLAAACGDDTPATNSEQPGQATASATTTAPRDGGQTPEAGEADGGTLFGVAGLIPPGWPDPAEDDWSTLLEGQIPGTGTLLGVYQDFAGASGPVALAFNLAEQQDVIPVVGLGVKRDAPRGGATLGIDPGDPTARAQFIATAVDLVQEHGIDYLLVDTEVNRLYADDPAAFDAFVALYIDTYDAVKAVSPSTSVFTAFQLETLRGGGYLTGREWQESWQLIDRFGDRLDIVGFTTYPFFDYESPADIPDGYYAEAASHAGGRPIAFTEIGWPSAPISTAPESAYGGTEAEQVEFIERFAELTAGLDVDLALWAFPNDIGPTINPSFEYISLRTNDGTAKPALAAWQALAGVE